MNTWLLIASAIAFGVFVGRFLSDGILIAIREFFGRERKLKRIDEIKRRNVERGLITREIRREIALAAGKDHLAGNAWEANDA